MSKRTALATRNSNGTIPPMLVSALARTLTHDASPKATIAAVRKARAILEGLLP